jgi:hypothetical protein
MKIEISPRALLVINVIIIILYLSGCSASEEKNIDLSFITDYPCKAPCWYGLELNKSSRVELLEVIAKLPFVNQNTIQTRNFTSLILSVPITVIYAQCGEYQSDDCISITLKDNIVVNISHLILYNLTVNDVIKKIGEPRIISHGPSSLTIETCEILLFWPSLNIWATINVENGKKVCRKLDSGVRFDLDLQVWKINYGIDNYFTSVNPNQYPNGYWRELISP